MAEAVLSCNPTFEDLACNEVRRATRSTPVFYRLAPGVVRATFAGTYDTLALQWARRPPIYVHHVFPLQRDTGLDALQASALSLRTTVEPGATCAVRVRYLQGPWRAATLESALERGLGLPIDTRDPAWVLNVVVGRERAWLGAAPRAWTVSPWAFGAYPTPPDRERINRSELKLMEAIDTFGIRLRLGMRGLDLGASPGGWTRVLTGRGLDVVSVDPDPLMPTIAAKTVHVPMRAEAYLAVADGPFDIIVNDMIMSPAESSALMVRYAQHLRPGGTAVLTLKLGNGRRRSAMDHSLRILRRAYRIPRLRQLFYNKNEVTVWLKHPAPG